MANSDNDLILQRFFDLSADPMGFTSQAGVLAAANPALCELLGVNQDGVVGLSLFDYFHRDDLAKVQPLIDTVANTRQSVLFRFRVRTGDVDYVIFAGALRFDSASDSMFWVGGDVSEQINAQERLIQLESALATKTIFARTDSQGVIREVSDTFCSISGYSRSELIGNTHRLVASGEHSQSFFENLWSTISSGRVWQGVIKNRTKRGEIYYVQTLIIPIFDSDGSIFEYLAIRQDVTDLIEVRSESRRLLDILNETNKIARIGGWELDVATGSLNWTDETFRILEVKKQKDQTPVLAEGLQLFIPEHIPIVDEAVSRAIEFGETYNLEVKARTAKGNDKWVYTTGRPNLKRGKVVSLSGTIQDIDHIKTAELKYDQERQKSIHNAKLASLGELAASVAHEINNPLGIISGSAELLKATSKSLSAEKAESRADIIIKSCDRIAHIVRGLKKYSSSGERREWEVCSLAQIVREALLLTGAKAKSSQVDVTVALDEDTHVFCNEIEVEQVVINLVNNALDAVAELETKFVDLRVATVGENAVFWITDSGPGICPDQAKRIFDPFYTTKDPESGTGLGLSIVSTILEEHRATINVDQECENTRFVIRFPAAASAM